MAKISNDGKYVTVERGDTLSAIARNYGNGKTYQQLAAINDIPNPDLIYIGQQIKLTSDESSSSTSSSDNMVTIKHFGPMADSPDTLFVTWKWSRTNTKHFSVRWEYYTADKTWFVGDASTTEYKYSTFAIPENAKQVRVKVKPVSETYKTKSSSKEVAFFTSVWTEWQTHAVVDIEVPPTPSVTLEGLKLTAEVDNLKKSPSMIQFKIVKNNADTYKTAKVNVSTAHASYSCTILAGSTYKVQCRANKDGVYSDWSEFSSNYDTIPSTPSKFTKCEPKTETSIYLEWSSVTNATSYDIEYATDKTHFDGSDQVTTKNGITTHSYELSSDIEKGKEYFFRVRAVNNQGTSGWSEIASTLIGKGPAAPTTWSSTTTAIVGESLTLYWMHNSEDGSKQTFAHLEVYIDGALKIDQKIDYTTSTEDENRASTFAIDTSNYAEGAQLRWRVRTAGITKQYGEFSIERVVDIYAPPVLSLSVSDLNGDDVETLTSFPINISAIPGPDTQRAIGYHLAISSKEAYETVDALGNTKMVNEGEVVYSKYFDISSELSVELSAGDVDLENNVEYTITCVVSMNSGLTATSLYEFIVGWSESLYTPNAEIGIDEDSFSAYIKPYCVVYESSYHRVSYSGRSYSVTSEVIESAYGIAVKNALTPSGEQVFYGITGDGVELYYCEVVEAVPASNVMLAVYRREFDGSFIEIASGLDGSKNTYVTDPHPSLDYARYRIVATAKDTGAVTYYDPPGYPVGGTSIIIQWDEKWSTFDTFGIEDALEQPPWTGSLLKLPYNIDVSDKHDPDVEHIEYIGRKHPVGYYGTQLGEKSTWNVVIDKNDVETLYALRRLAIWMGNVYVREPSGSGYWASINVLFSKKHDELTIPVTIDVTRVEGGV